MKTNANFLVELWLWAWSVVSRWQAYVTGSLFTAAGSIYEHASGKMISANTVKWGAVGFFVAGAFMAWREQYQRANQLGRPLELREELDGLAKRGQQLLDLWKSGQRPRLRSKNWDRSVMRFARRFKMIQFDSVSTHRLSNEDAVETGIDLPTTESYQSGMFISARLAALKKLRKQIRD